MIDTVCYDIPIEYRDRYRELLGQDSVPVGDLRQELEAYLATVRQVAKMVALLDLGQAERLGKVALSLLDEADPDDAEQRRVVQAAVRYLISEEDDEEITGVLGFDDDVHVMNAVSRAMGRADLLIEMKQND